VVDIQILAEKTFAVITVKAGPAGGIAGSLMDELMLEDIRFADDGW